MASRSQKNVLVIGCGLHFRRIYRRYLHDLRDAYNVHLKAVVDLHRERFRVRRALEEMGMDDVEILTTESFSSDTVPVALETELDQLVQKHALHAVIIATEPSAHKPYALWSLSRNLHVLMDKPISARANAVSDPAQASEISRDYLDLLRAYHDAQGRAQTFFCVNVQRRFHPGFAQVLELIRQVRDQTNCPVTSVLSMHCDGQWRLPLEIRDLDYHGYNHGYGKVSHGGYHHIDMAYQFMRAGYVPDKWPQEAQVYSSFLLPTGFLNQIRMRDYRRCFGSQAAAYSERELQHLFQGYGEIDAHADISLIRGGTHVGHISIHLLHNSFSRRSWVAPNLGDLYKGNGRVKAEFHSIQQGPFQNIQIHSFQSKDKHDVSTWEDYQIGGNNHFDIYIFRNVGILGTDPFQKISIETLFEPTAGKLVIEEVKRRVLEEFFDAIDGRIAREELRSSIESHAVPTRLMSAIYVSHVERMQGRNPVVSCPFNDCVEAPASETSQNVPTPYAHFTSGTQTWTGRKDHGGIYVR